jgi:hypothetical protein
LYRPATNTELLFQAYRRQGKKPFIKEHLPRAASVRGGCCCRSARRLPCTKQPSITALFVLHFFQQQHCVHAWACERPQALTASAPTRPPFFFDLFVDLHNGNIAATL